MLALFLYISPFLSLCIWLFKVQTVEDKILLVPFHQRRFQFGIHAHKRIISKLPIKIYYNGWRTQWQFLIVFAQWRLRAKIYTYSSDSGNHFSRILSCFANNCQCSCFLWSPKDNCYYSAIQCMCGVDTT